MISQLRSLFFLLLVVGASLVITVPYPAQAAPSSQDTANANAAANTYCLAKYPIEGNAKNPSGGNPVDANFSARETCIQYYAQELEAKYYGGSKPTTSQCNALGGSKAGICKSAIAAASTAPKPGKAAPPTIPSGPTTPSTCSASGACIDANAVGIPQVGIGSGLQTIVNILSFVAGALSVAFLAIGGIRYSTSEGQSQNLAQAKQTITFAILGLAISILAPLIVDFVIARGPQ
ncbi:MAG TPA: pilin [Candidatus Saccharimonadales bacterium]|nr:pilin [Candidatus Saccharimonadales bacterium]